MAQTGYGDGVPQGTGSYYADPITGAHATVGILAALLARERTGNGQRLDMALQESAAAFMVESIMDYRLNGRVARPRGNRSTRIAPQGAYRSLGTDCWLAIGVETDDQWRALCAAIERPDLADRFPTREARLGAHDEIDVAIEAWSETRNHNRAAELLQEAGVPAGPVLANWEIVSDPHLYERGYFVDIVHPTPGTSAGTASRGGSRGPRRAFAGRPPASRSTTTRSWASWASARRRSGACTTNG